MLLGSNVRQCWRPFVVQDVNVHHHLAVKECQGHILASDGPGKNKRRNDRGTKFCVLSLVRISSCKSGRAGQFIKLAQLLHVVCIPDSLEDWARCSGRTAQRRQVISSTKNSGAT